MKKGEKTICNTYVYSAYHTKVLSDFKVRELANLIIGEMTSRKMKVAGYVYVSAQQF